MLIIIRESGHSDKERDQVQYVADDRQRKVRLYVFACGAHVA